MSSKPTKLYFLFFSLFVTFPNSQSLDDVQNEGMVELDDFSVCAATQAFNKVSVTLRMTIAVIKFSEDISGAKS